MPQKLERRTIDSDRLQKLVDVGLALSYEKDLDRILELVLEAAREVTYADAGTLYLLEEGLLHFKIVQNDTLKIRMGGTSGQDIPFPPVELVESNVSAYVALNGISENIPDVYETDLFDFTGPKKFDRSTGYHSKSMLVVPMKNHENEVIGVLQLLNAKNRKTGEFFAFREHSEGVVSSLASQAAVALTNNRLVSNLQKNFEEIKGLQASEEELNNKLRDAFRDVEHKNSELEGALKKVRMIRYYALAFIVLIGIGGGLYSSGMLRSLSGALEQFSRSQQVEEPVPTARRSATVSRGPVSASITMSGTLKPLRTVNVPSSIAGTISQINFEYGGNVKEKQLLVKLNAEKLESEYREATTELIQAEDEFEVLENWENSLEVVKAKRAIDNAKIAVEKAERDLTYAEKLFKMEIISANELESSQATLHTAKESHQTALEQLEVTLAKAGEAEMLIAENKLNSARAKVAALEAKLDKIVAVAPISGVILDPGAGVGRAGSLLDVGSEVKAGAVLARIGDLSGFSIEARVDEVDVGKVKEGQTVLVTGDAFPGSVLRGKVASLSSQASGGTQGFGGERPSFHLLVEVKNIKRRLRKKLRVGMSANLEIITYKNDKALLLPVEAVQMMGADTGLVMRQPAGQVAPEQVEVKVGRTTLDSVEILEGLHENDTILY